MTHLPAEVRCTVTPDDVIRVVYVDDEGDTEIRVEHASGSQGVSIFLSPESVRRLRKALKKAARMAEEV